MSPLHHAFVSGHKLPSMLLACGTALMAASVFAAPPPNGAILTFIDCVQAPGPTFTGGVGPAAVSLPQPNLSIRVYNSNDTPFNNPSTRFASGGFSMYLNNQGTVQCATSDGCYVEWSLFLNNPADPVPRSATNTAGTFGVLRPGIYSVTQDPSGTRAILGCGT
jgi:hypothetical protein